MFHLMQDGNMGLTFAFGRGGTRPPSVTPDIEAPSAPTGLTASSVTQTTLTLTWSASTDNVGVVGYDVYNGSTLAETVTGLTASITGLTANTQYNFTVRAKDAAGNISEPSNVETVTTLEPVIPAPTGLTATAESDTEISLSWTDNAVSDSFTVQRSLNGTDWTDIANPIAPGWTDEGLTPETLYYYRVKSVVDGISSEYSTAANATTQATAPPPDTDIYIDPTNVLAGRDGSIENPYNSFTEAGFTSGNVYRLKAGTEIVLSSELNFSGHTATFVSRYGVGVDPKIKSTVSGTCAVRFAGSTLCVLDHVEGYTDLTNSLITFIQMGTGTAFDGGTGNVISNCFIHHVKQGSADGGMGIRGGGTTLSVINTRIEDCGCDGMYVRDVPGILVDGCDIYRINQNYAGAAVGFNNLGSGASGDGIQLDGSWDGFIIRNTTVDRSDPYTGNKFCVIFNSGNSSAWSWSGVVEHCTFKTRSTVPYAVDQVMGTGVIYRYNTFLGSTIGVRLEGANVHDTLFHHNVFIDCTNPIRIGSTYSGTIGPATGTMVYNNVFYMSRGTGTVLSDITLDRTHVDTCNNIHYNTNSAISAIHNFGSGVIDRKSNNCYYGGITSGFGGDGVNPVFGNPAFVDAVNGDFHIELTSACRNAGVDVNIDKDYDGVSIPQETNPAIGAFEYIQ